MAGAIGAPSAAFGGDAQQPFGRVGEAIVKSVARNVSGQLTRSVTRELVRGVLGNLVKGLR